MEKKLQFIGGLNHGLEGEWDDDGTDCSSVDEEHYPAHPKMMAPHTEDLAGKKSSLLL